MLAPIWRTRLFAIGGSVLALSIGVAVARQELAWPLLCLAGVAVLLLMRLQPLSVGTVLLGMSLLGYIVGNRGFAQLYLTSDSMPLLPAELVLLVAGSILFVQSAFRHEMLFSRDPLNAVLLLWIVIGTGRLMFDLRAFGLLAVRDFATVYYAAFFFLAQRYAREPTAKRFLLWCLVAGFTLLLPVYLLSLQFPDFFLNTLTLGGAPLILYKGDLAGTFLAIGALIYFIRFETRGRWWCLALSLVFIAETLASNNRASILALGVATLLLLLGGRWRFAAMQIAAGVVAALVIMLAAHWSGTALEKTSLYGHYEQTLSLGDPLGQRSYSSEDSLNKGDDNLFRVVWWHTVFDETIGGHSWFGLGFGHDLADRFVQEYYPGLSDEFSIRSPHNVLLTIFARMGMAGLLPFLVIMGLMAVRTFHAIRSGQNDNIMLWCSAWMILTSACFGVVLEGPMGAVVFWTVLGMANSSVPEKPAAAVEKSPTAAETLHEAGEKF